MRHIQKSIAESIIGKKGGGPRGRVTPIPGYHKIRMRQDDYGMDVTVSSSRWYIFHTEDAVLLWAPDASWYPYHFKTDRQWGSTGPVWASIDIHKMSPEEAYEYLMSDFIGYLSQGPNIPETEVSLPNNIMTAVKLIEKK